MANQLQRLLYYLTNVIPGIFLFCLIGIFTFASTEWKVMVLGLALSALLAFAFYLSFSYTCDNIPGLRVKITDISSISINWAKYLSVVVSGCLPIIKEFIKNYRFAESFDLWMIFCVVCLFLSCYISSEVNMILSCIGYHFYKFKSSAGVSNEILISRKVYRNSDAVCHVKRFFEGIYIDGDE